MELAKIGRDRLKLKLPEFKLDDGVWIYGGSIRDSIINTKFDDIDVFGKNVDVLKSFVEKNLDGYKQVFSNEALATYKNHEYKVQVINRHIFDNIHDLIDSADFTICQFAFDGENVFCNPNALIDLFNRKLVVHKLKDDTILDSLRRMQKYIKKGYTICNGGLIEITKHINSISEKQIEEQIEFYPNTNTPRIISFD